MRNAPALPLLDDEARHGIGGNSPPDEFATTRADFDTRVKAALSGANIWEKRPTFDKDLAERANDYLAGLRKLIGLADKARLAETKPHRDRTDLINKWWSSRIEMAQKAIGTAQPQLDAYKRDLQRKADEERRAAEQRQREAAEAARLAELEAAQARTASAQIEAEARAAELAQQAKEAAHDVRAASAPVMVGSATGLANRSGIRNPPKRARITNITLAFAYFRGRSEVAELIERLANAEMRGAPTIRGEKVIPVIPGVEWDSSEEIAG